MVMQNKIMQKCPQLCHSHVINYENKVQKKSKQFPEGHTVSVCSAFVNGHATLCEYECAIDTT